MVLSVTVHLAARNALCLLLLTPNSPSPSFPISVSPRPSPDERPYWLAWPQIEGIGPNRLKQLFLHFGSLQAAWEATAGDFLQVERIGLTLADAIARERDALDVVAVSNRLIADVPDGVNVITPADNGYPPMLWEIPDPPPMLYIKGQRRTWSPAIAIVGTRSPSKYGLRWTEAVATGLVSAGFAIVSGMALGVDAVAHQAAIDAGQPTLAVLGTGVDVVYPGKHHHLAAQIQEIGMLVSEYPCGTGPARANFPRRNRIVAALAQATLIMEAPSRSGALITARLANDYNRDVYALPGALDTPQARGCLELIDRGAIQILGVTELLDSLGSPLSCHRSDRATAASNESPPNLSGIELEIWNALEESLPFDVLAVETGLDASTLSSTLLMMELGGTVEQLPGMRYCRGSAQCPT
ncbi:MAG: DNA-processing protein DprA [Synechococcus sp.]